MTTMQEKFLIIEKNSKIYLVSQSSYDKKRRKYLVSKYSENSIFEISNKDIIFSEVMPFDRASQDPKSNYELKELWLDLIVNNNIINFEVFIKKEL